MSEASHPRSVDARTTRPRRLSRGLLIIAATLALLLLIHVRLLGESATLDEALTYYYENDLGRALPLLEQLVAQQGDDAQAHAWLAETHRRLGMKNEAVRVAKTALSLDPCNSFAHTVMADACRRLPGESGLSDSDTTWVHLRKAVQCDSSDGNAWASTWCEAILREKFDLMDESLRRMKESGFLTKAVLAYGRWMLRTLPPNTILVTNGDMDTYPPLAVQTSEGFRPDVVVVERGVLGTRQFQTFLRDHRGVPLAIRGSQASITGDSVATHGEIHSRSRAVFDGWLEQGRGDPLARPVAVALTVDQEFYRHVEDSFQYAGPFLLWQAKPVGETPDTTALAASLAGVHVEDFTGPWASQQDRSPVRRTQTKRLAANVTRSALALAEALIHGGKMTQALKTLKWAGRFEAATELGPVFSERISELEKAATE